MRAQRATIAQVGYSRTRFSNPISAPKGESYGLRSLRSACDRSNPLGATKIRLPPPVRREPLAADPALEGLDGAFDLALDDHGIDELDDGLAVVGLEVGGGKVPTEFQADPDSR